MSRDLRVIVDGRPLVPRRSGIGVHTAEIAGRLDVTPPPLIASHAEIINKQGIERCRFRVDRAPNGIRWHRLGIVYYRENRWEEARDALDQALARTAPEAHAEREEILRLLKALRR